MAGENLDKENIDLIIEDLKTSFDNLERGNSEQVSGFQVKLAKTIASLRQTKVLKMDIPPTPVKEGDDKDPKNYLLNQLDFFLYLLDQLEGTSTETQKKKVELILKIAQLREKLREF